MKETTNCSLCNPVVRHFDAAALRLLFKLIVIGTIDMIETQM
jgi:hypothetical protein